MKLLFNVCKIIEVYIGNNLDEHSKHIHLSPQQLICNNFRIITGMYYLYVLPNDTDTTYG